MRVLFVANDPPGQAVYRYRCENFAPLLREAGCAVDVVYVNDRHVSVDHDIVVLHRICAVAEGRAYARAARACGAALVYGADDLVFDPAAFGSDTAPAHRRMRQYAPLHAAMLREADAVLVSTEFLGDQARAVGGEAKPVFVLRNFLSDELLRISEAAREAAPVRTQARITLGYLSGTPTHDADLETIARPLTETLRGRDVDLLLVGPVQEPVALRAADLKDRIRRHSFVPWRDLPSVLAEVDVNLAPLDLTNPLTHGKSEIKLLEAAALGIPTIASASAGFREALAAHPAGGVLAATEEEWRSALTSLQGDPNALRRAGKAAHAYLMTAGTAAAHREQVIAVFDQISAIARPRPETPRATTVGSALSAKYWVKSALQRAKKL